MEVRALLSPAPPAELGAAAPTGGGGGGGGGGGSRPAQPSAAKLAAREFEWALSSAAAVGSDPAGTGAGSDAEPRNHRLSYAGALIALRQLTYLNGLPALGVDAAHQLFDAHNAGGGKDLGLEEFNAAFVHLLHAALAEGEGPPGGIGVGGARGDSRLHPGL